MSTIETVWESAKRLEGLLKADLNVPDHDLPLLEAARNVASRIEMAADAFDPSRPPGERRAWQGLEDKARTVVNLVHMCEPSDDATDRQLADAAGCAGFIDQEAGREAERCS